MLELSKTVLQSSVWKNTLGITDTDHSIDIERLRNSFIQFRERAAQLANEIRTDLPELTIHDITHLDSLWETGSQIIGENYKLTPTEGYVLGGAILLHDLGMSIAATPGGAESLKNTQRWIDLIHSTYQTSMGRQPTLEEVQSPPADIYKTVVFELLRRIHAENAEKLAFSTFNYKGTNLYLIEDPEIRQSFGRVIGEIAHSHWWSISEIERRFTDQIGSPPWASASDWHVNPLKLACILRAADAAHLDARRAPTFVRSLTTLNSTSAQHWDFQEKLLKPYLKEDALIFTSGESFPLQEASAWWTCLDSLRMVDKELRNIDALLTEHSEPRFSAKRVAGADQPERLAKYIRTQDWHPINATISISDIPNIIKSIGGEELYGKNPQVPLRELIQNSSDAIRARRYYEDRTEDYGEIVVELTELNSSHWLTISDNGTGMSMTVLTDFLLDFGKSFWSSNRVHEEFPGLLSSGFKSTGKYGIGFFSAFMISEKIKVITRHAESAKKDTLVLEFGSSLRERPILRPASSEECIRDGGTKICLQLRTPPTHKGGILYTNDEQSISLNDLCTFLAPATDATIYTIENGTRTLTAKGNDWKEIDGKELLSRLQTRHFNIFKKQNLPLDTQEKISQNIRPIKSSDGEIIGRACISSSFAEHDAYIRGALVIGGLEACLLWGICGILLGKPLRASRDESEPLATPEELSTWASEQAHLVPNLFPEKQDQLDCAETILNCGGDSGPLPICRFKDQYYSEEELSQLTLPEELIIIPSYEIYSATRNIENPKLNNNIITCSTSLSSHIIHSRNPFISSNNYFESSIHGKKKIIHRVLRAIAKSWNVEQETLIDFVIRENDEDTVLIGNSPSGPILAEGVMVTKADFLAQRSPSNDGKSSATLSS
ncbi:hypothetical protein Pstr01_24130 [Pseudomonas straminea]|uniref:Histidine kinase-, DNA gyrase B-, and HSP90-like ATPase n=2 Tax=Pseudomonas straminea TaxID=47882 RepID=A0A1I1UI30_PSEOC|nr:hypothetical protein Pstr01_24130 [Pseudomonas straminea]SFD70516.1 Histidine kinase-, DNA gyrase B-, and HSP90-like ATPase [Pseudomonas straminea]